MAHEDIMMLGTDEVDARTEDWKVLGWVKNVSKHLSHIEMRMMHSEILGHEVVRQVQQLLDGFSPPPRGDWGWLLRHVTDLGVSSMRQMTKYYMRSSEGAEAFVKKAVKVVRLFVEEAWRRALMGAEGKLLKSAMCNMIRSMRQFEESSLNQYEADFGFFWSFSPEAVQKIAKKMGAGVRTSVEDLPSYHEVMSMELLRMEVFSLMMVRDVDGHILMSQREVRAKIESVTGHLTDEEALLLPGTEEASIYEAFFDDEVSESDAIVTG